ncbi:MAG: hypothetical protein JSS49_03960 [Planctomycetes bacterium]|nr:hypothetical protein [Planctomycetota bacterium]
MVYCRRYLVRLLLAGTFLIWSQQSGFGQEQFPIVPYSGMQLTYTVSGAEVTESKDSQDFTRLRTLTGHLQGEELRIIGEFVCRDPEKTELRVEIWVDDQKQGTTYSSADLNTRLNSPQRYELKLAVPRDAKKAGFVIIAKAETVLGAREVNLRGEFTAAVPSSQSSNPESDSPDKGVAGVAMDPVRGVVQTRAPGDSDWKAVSAGDQLLVGTRIQTGDESSVKLQLSAQDVVFLDRESEVVLRENGIFLERGSLKLSCSQGETPHLLITPEFFTEFRGQHVGIERANDRTTIWNMDGVAKATLRKEFKQGITVHAGIRVEGDEEGFDLFESIDLSHENSTWEQAGLGRIIVSPPNVSVATDNPKTDAIPGIVVAPTPLNGETGKSGENLGKRIPIELPADPDISIVVLDSVGGYTLERKSKEPELVIYADGRAVITDPFGRLPKVTRHLTGENVKQFLDFAVNEQHYYDLSTEGLENLIKQIRAQGAVPQITDMPTSIIRIGILNKTYEVRCQTPAFFASRFPEITPFQRYNAIHSRLTKFVTASREWADKQNR